ncbi:hypothetical protein LEN26_007300 [Aphanomyces euteiches]|nr:hypothetical protein AeMF1_011522 [Aphanomyces euteiches]KAH9132730.1 hypothetical protein LEN26_007300 [Aphanomyces euteiches]KAH9189219.1 hypothetical protein AeNC1_008801 [Aphanomyces euteiches]
MDTTAKSQKERIAAQKKAWDARNRDKKRAQMKAYYMRNKARIKQYRDRVKQNRTRPDSTSSSDSAPSAPSSPPLPSTTPTAEPSPHMGPPSPMNIAALLNPLT